MDGPTAVLSQRGERAAMVRPGGRNERVRLAVAEAVLELFREGRSGFGAAEVAKRASVHRSTVYRRWPTTADLIGEALTLHTDSLRIPDTGSWENDVHALAAELASFFSNPVEITMNSAMAGGSDHVLSELLTAHWMPLIRKMSHVVARAVERTELRADTDPMLIVQLLVSPMLVQTVFGGTRPTPAFVRQLAEVVVRGTTR